MATGFCRHGCQEGASNNSPVGAGFPPGVLCINQCCLNIYPSQPNPLQVTTLTKFWLGGPHPLDYISMYENTGDDEIGVPPHWHYISFGLSDLHGDGRVHDVSGPDAQSGYGFELTFRLIRSPGESAPPTWPALLMQDLARYVFHSDNVLCSGDHVSWHNALDDSDSRMQHMIMADDPQLSAASTPSGTVSFVQIVGVTYEELQATQRWNGPGMLDLMRSIPVSGGPWLVTDMRRGESIFDICPQLQEKVDEGVRSEGSNLSGVIAKCGWKQITDTDDLSTLNEFFGPTGKFDNEGKPVTGEESAAASVQQHDNVCDLSELKNDTTGELLSVKFINCVHLKFNIEAGQLLPLCIGGRLKHGRHFTFRSVAGDCAVTFITPSVSGAFVDKQHPFASHGPWLQILLNEEFIDQLCEDFQPLTEPDKLALPKHYNWPDRGLMISIYPDDDADQ